MYSRRDCKVMIEPCATLVLVLINQKHTKTRGRWAITHSSSLRPSNLAMLTLRQLHERHKIFHSFTSQGDNRANLPPLPMLGPIG